MKVIRERTAGEGQERGGVYEGHQGEDCRRGAGYMKVIRERTAGEGAGYMKVIRERTAGEGAGYMKVIRERTAGEGAGCTWRAGWWVESCCGSPGGPAGGWRAAVAP